VEGLFDMTGNKRNKRVLAAAIVALVIMAFGHGASWADALSRKNTKANKFYKEEKYDEAAKKYLDAQLESPESRELAYNLGNANYKMKKYDKAVEYYQKAMQTKNPGFEEQVAYNMGNALFKIGEFEAGQGKQEGLQKMEQAITSYKRALDLNPNDKDAKYNLEYVRRKLKEMSKREPQQNQQQQQQQKQNQQKEDQKKDQQQQQQQAQADSTKQDQKKEKKPGDMSEEEAKRLLDAYKDAEKEAKEKEPQKRAGRVMIEKDW
jgi:Ca-activated chloride channel homolog